MVEDLKIGIHISKNSFSDRWIAYCEDKGIQWKEVNCYSNDIIDQLSDCTALMWHINQGNSRDSLFAKQLIFSVQASGKKVFPNFSTVWHFDDKVGQKYLLEAVKAPLAKSWVFYDKKEALAWAREMDFPKVFKLRGGAGSQNVKIVLSSAQAKKLIFKAFNRGIPIYDAKGRIKESWRRYRMGKGKITEIFIGILRLFIHPKYARIRGRDRGYIYFQDFIPNNYYDIRIIVIDDKAFAIKRLVRKGDFRASGSGMILYDKENFNEETVRLAFEMAEKIDSQCAAFDFVYDENKIYTLEVSFGFVKEVYDPCTGYWDKDLVWHEGKFNPYGWMVESLI